MSVQDLMWVITKNHRKRDYLLITVDSSGTRKWSLDFTVCRLFMSKSRAEVFIHDHAGRFNDNVVIKRVVDV